MKIELRNVKYLASVSEETPCYSATIFVDGKKAGECSNHGRGGQTEIRPYSLRVALGDYCKAHKLGSDFEPAESYLDELLGEWLAARELKRLLAKKVAFTRTDASGVYASKPKVAVAEVVRSFTANPDVLARFKEKAKADKILNLLPFSEALAIWTADTETAA